MAEEVLTITPDTTEVDGALGNVLDADGNIVSTDPVVSGSWSVDDASLGSIATPDGLSTVVSLTGSPGTLSVRFSGVTESGAAVTGGGQIVLAAAPTPPISGAVSVEVILTAVAPTPAPSPDPTPTPDPTPAPAAEFFTFTGDSTTIDASAWPKADVVGANGEVLYTHATSDPFDASVWVVYTGATQPAPAA